ncbi:ABC transporter ATP-binding protein [Rhodococcus xishaensis]|uniref:ABC transporter ATP-binding protein n=1 Tax=Rhodococcus xishaensis TaxID=2487364 RepID=A0A3S3AKD3_9NOCA|nr:ABC transporter ATP-binding protein [Rhodococcus xishaensis]RVW02716.1 ABC transporter ATP-binding protein [Rhodococcus xishaensis]
MSSFISASPIVQSPPRSAVRLTDVRKTYRSGRTRVTALDHISVTLTPGSFTAIMGPSGCGKSTLLHCAAGLDQPTRGSVWLGETEITALKPKARSVFRRDNVGFVFQAYNLMAALTVEQNVTLPLLLARRRTDRTRLEYVLAAVGLADKRDRRPAELSGGQQQRVAIARALITKPHAVFADEPTGALDSRSARQVLDLLRRATTELGQTVVMVTHDPVAAAHADRVLFLADGRLVGHMDSPTVAAVTNHMTHLGEW